MNLEYTQAVLLAVFSCHIREFLSRIFHRPSWFENSCLVDWRWSKSSIVQIRTFCGLNALYPLELQAKRHQVTLITSHWCFMSKNYLNKRYPSLTFTFHCILVNYCFCRRDFTITATNKRYALLNKNNNKTDKERKRNITFRYNKKLQKPPFLEYGWLQLWKIKITSIVATKCFRCWSKEPVKSYVLSTYIN